MTKITLEKGGGVEQPHPSMPTPLRVLILEDSTIDAELCLAELKKSEFEFNATVVDNEHSFVSTLKSRPYDLILSDYRIPGWTGVDAFRHVKDSGLDIPFILVTGTLGEEAAVDFIKEGIADYILKDRLTRLPQAVRRALQDKQIHDERERATQALRESEEKVRLLLDSTAEAIYGVDLEGKCTLCNPASVKLLGYDGAADFLGKQMHALIHHTRADGTPYPFEECPIVEALRYGGGNHGEDEIMWKKDGSSFPVEYWCYPMFKDGALVGSVVTFLDITERKQAEQKLRSSEARARHLVESNIIGVAIGDLSGKLLDANRAYLDLIGYTKEDLLSGQLRWDALTPPEYRDMDQQKVEELNATGTASPWEKQYIRKDGSRVSILIGVAAHASENGGVEAITFVLDITERKQMEKSLRRVAAVVDSSHDAIASETLDGTIVTWNAGAEQMYGYSAAEAIGKSFGIIVPPDRHGEFRNILETIKNGQKVDQFETVRVRKDGTQISISLTVCPIKDIRGRIVGASAIARDITESKRMEEMFRQAQKMEAVGRLAGGVAHDFNNLLGVIIGYGEMLEERLNNDDPLRSKVEQITKAGRRAAGLTRQLLAFSRQQVLAPKVLSLNSIVADVQKMLQRLIGEDIKLITVLSPHPDCVRADQGQIEQVIMNLAVNARDAMPDGGTLTIETATVTLDECDLLIQGDLASGPFLVLSVADTGTGMDAETQKHIFEPFFTTKGEGKGTGLGLATVYGVVKQSGGHISVESELGRGTTFRIYLPQVKPVDDAQEQVRAPKEQFEGTETILLVEDEESLRSLTREVLQGSHYTVLEAIDGLDALEIAKGHEGPIHLLLTDVVMPRMNGPELARELAVRNPDIKTLFMSGYISDSSVVQGLANREGQFLQKPFTSDGLTRKIRELLGVPAIRH